MFRFWLATQCVCRSHANSAWPEQILLRQCQHIRRTNRLVALSLVECLRGQRQARLEWHRALLFHTTIYNNLPRQGFFEVPLYCVRLKLLAFFHSVDIFCWGIKVNHVGTFIAKHKTMQMRQKPFVVIWACENVKNIILQVILFF